MGRTRLLSPEFFRDEDLAALPYAARLLFQGTWILANRDGRLEDRPKRIKIEIFPYDDENIDELLTLLANAGFIERYKIAGKSYIQIRSFLKYQRPHKNELTSEFPGPTKDRTARTKARTARTKDRSDSDLGTNESDLGSPIQIQILNTDTDTDTRERDACSDSEKLSLSDSDLEEIQKDELYAHRDVQFVRKKFRSYYGRDPTRQELLGWLNREKGDLRNDGGTEDQIERVVARLSGDH